MLRIEKTEALTKTTLLRMLRIVRRAPQLPPIATPDATHLVPALIAGEGDEAAWRYIDLNSSLPPCACCSIGSSPAR